MLTGARLTVLQGPDRGKTFPLSVELAHIGRSDSNQVVLSDPLVAAHQASIVCRGGRFALFAPLPDSVFVDGAAAPPERWIWLPSTADIGIGETVVRFIREIPPPGENGGAPGSGGRDKAGAATAGSRARTTGSELAPDAASVAGTHGAGPATPAAGRTSSESTATPSAKKEGSSSSARRRRRRDSRNDTANGADDGHAPEWTRLSADGRLPELTLKDSASGDATADAAPGPSSGWAMLAIGLSLAASLALLMWDFEGAGPGRAAHSAAREQLQNYFGREGSELLPYQQWLRQARMAHSQGRTAEERRLYLKVLDQLNASDSADPSNLNGLTGRQTGRGRNSDRELRALLETLVAAGRDEAP